MYMQSFITKELFKFYILTHHGLTRCVLPTFHFCTVMKPLFKLVQILFPLQQGQSWQLPPQVHLQALLPLFFPTNNNNYIYYILYIS